jgi:hypothetical protein
MPRGSRRSRGVAKICRRATRGRIGGLVIVRLALLGLAACHALPVPPLVAPMTPLDPADRGATTAMLVVGVAGQGIGGGGLGVAVRVERQTTDRTTLGLELSGGRGDEIRDDTRADYRMWIVGARAYGRTMSSAGGGDVTGYTYGAGLAWMRTGAWVAQLHAGVAGELGSEHAAALGDFGLALAVPLVHGHAYGDIPFSFMPGPPEPGLPRASPPAPELGYPCADLYLTTGLGAAGRASSNALTLDLGFAFALRAKQVVWALMLADAQRL